MEVFNIHPWGVSPSLLLLLLVPPSLSGGQDNVVVRAGETISLSYKVQGTPTPTIQWEHTNKLISQSSRVKITSEGINILLTIVEVGRHDEGLYTCTALNSLGSTSTQTRVVVHGKLRQELEQFVIHKPIGSFLWQVTELPAMIFP